MANRKGKIKKKPDWIDEVKVALTETGLTMGKLEKITGVSKSTISRWFSGQTYPKNTNTMRVIVEALFENGVSQSSLCGLVKATVKAGGNAEKAIKELINSGVISKPRINSLTLLEVTDMHETMNEEVLSHFGLKTTPFGQLKGKADVYFHPALKKLRKEVVDNILLDDSIIVVTAQTGAGKTMFKRMLVDTLEKKQGCSVVEPDMLMLKGLNEKAIQSMFQEKFNLSRSCGPGSSIRNSVNIKKALAEVNGASPVVVVVDQFEDVEDDTITLLKRLNEMTDGWTKLVRVIVFSQEKIVPRMKGFNNRQFAIRASFKKLPQIDDIWKFVKFRFERIGCDEQQLKVIFPDETVKALQTKHKALKRSKDAIPRRLENLVTKAMLKSFEFGDKDVKASTVNSITEI